MIRSCHCLLGLLLLVPLQGLAQVPEQRQVEAGLLPAVVLDGKAQRWTIESRMARWNVPGVSVAVLEGGAIAWVGTYGVEDVSTGRPVSTATRFQAASISKPVAAAAVMALVSDGVLELGGDVQDSLGDWRIPRGPESGTAPVTLRQLLSHTAGTTVHGFPGYGRDVPLPSLRQILAGEPPANTGAVMIESVPGEGWRYSGGGYQVVQRLAEFATGLTFPELVRARVLDPVDMADSGYAEPTGDVAAGHDRDGKRIDGGWHVYPEAAAAGLWTTSTDLARFALALTEGYRGGDGGLLPDAAVQAMLTPVMNDYGLGPGVTGEGDALRISHGGSNAGYRAVWIVYPVTGDGVVVMTNGEAGDRLMMEIVRAVSAAYGWPGDKPVEESVFPLSSDALAAREGTWVTPYDGGRVEFVAERDGEGLAISTARGRFVFVPVSPNRMVSLETGSAVSFEDGPDGLVLSAFGMRLLRD